MAACQLCSFGVRPDASMSSRVFTANAQRPAYNARGDTMCRQGVRGGYKAGLEGRQAQI